MGVATRLPKLTTIGYAAFEFCTNLTKIELPHSLTTIEGYAFNKCNQLNTVIIDYNTISNKIVNTAFDWTKINKVIINCQNPTNIDTEYVNKLFTWNNGSGTIPKITYNNCKYPITTKALTTKAPTTPKPIDPCSVKM